MSHAVNIQDATGVIATVDGLKPIVLTGPTVPTDGTAGYAPGAIFLKNAGNGVGSTMYVNEGSVTSCDFNAK